MTIYLSDFGSMIGVESLEASIANQAAFTAAISAAVAAGIESITLPAGTMYVKADNGMAAGSGLRVVVPNGKTIRFFGQAGTVIKRLALAPPVALAASSAMVWMTANAGITIEWHHVTFDGNEANCEYDPAALYNEEQSANLRWLTGSGTPEAIRFFHCNVGKGRVGDGYMASVRVNHFMAANCSTLDTNVRRVRADWQFSRYATFDTVMTNIVCNSLESEPFDTQESARLMLSNVHARSVFDLAGDQNGTAIRPIKAQLTNVICMAEAGRAGLPFVNFWRVHGSAVNCHFRGIRRIQRCKIKFIGGSITVADKGGGVAEDAQVWFDHASEVNPGGYTDMRGGYVEFQAVDLLKDATATTGQFVSTAGTVEAANLIPGAPVPRLSIINCNVPEALNYVVVSNRSGVLEVKGGDLRANSGIINFGNDTTRAASLHCEASMIWQAPALMFNPYSIAPTTGKTTLNISGQFDGETMVPWENGGVRIADGGNTVWNVTAVALVDSDPQGRIRTVPGIRAKLRNQHSPCMWQAINTGTMGPTGHNGTDWIGTA